MSTGERIRILRKELDLSQTEFGERIGLKQAVIGLYENGQRNVTDRAIRDICREYNVDYIWLTTGEGEIFTKYSDDEETFFSAMDTILRGENDRRKNLIKSLLRASPDDVEALCRILDTYIDLLKGANEKPGD